MSRDTWSILPQPGDIVAEVRTRRFRTLTYARADGRSRRRHVLQPRAQAQHLDLRLAAEAGEPRRVTTTRTTWPSTTCSTTTSTSRCTPEREWLAGVAADQAAREVVHARRASNLKLADSYTISSITSQELGRLLFLRVRNQNAVVVNLPTPLSRDYELTLTVQLSGAHRAASRSTRSRFGRTARRGPDDMPIVPAEPNWLLSNRATLVSAGERHRLRHRRAIAWPCRSSIVVAASGVPADGAGMLPPAPAARSPGDGSTQLSHHASGALPRRASSAA